MSSFGLGIKPLSMDINLSSAGNFVATIQRKTGDWADGTTLAIVFDDTITWPATVVDDTASWNVPIADVLTLIAANPDEAQLIITAAGTPIVRGSGQINVDTSTSVGLTLGSGSGVVIDEVDQIIAVPVPGLPGPKGDKGDKGDPGSAPYTFVQASPAATWTIAHNLDGYPSFLLFTDGDPDTPVFTDITYPDSNTAVVTWPTAESGRAVA